LSEFDSGQFEADTEIMEPRQNDFVSIFRDVIKNKIKKPDNGDRN